MGVMFVLFMDVGYKEVEPSALQSEAVWGHTNRHDNVISRHSLMK
jgi:hypothetical protein